MPRFDRPTCAFVPAHGRTIIGRLRPFTSHLVKAIPFAVSFIAPLLHVTAGVIMGAAFTLVVNEPAIGEQRPIVLIERGHFIEREIMGQHRCGVDRIVRTTP